MLKKKKEENKDEIKIKNSKDILKLSDNVYIKVERDDNFVRIYKVNLYKGLFDSQTYENRIELVPKEEVDLVKLLEKVTDKEIILSDKLSNLVTTVNGQIDTIGTIGNYLKIGNMDISDDFAGQIDDRIKEGILIHEKELEYHNLFKTDYFAKVKDLDIFKNKTDVEIGDILVELLDSCNKDVLEKVKDITYKRRCKDV